MPFCTPLVYRSLPTAPLIVIGNSLNAKTIDLVGKSLNYKPVDFLFIDGGHTNEGVKDGF